MLASASCPCRPYDERLVSSVCSIRRADYLKALRSSRPVPSLPQLRLNHGGNMPSGIALKLGGGMLPSGADMRNEGKGASEDKSAVGLSESMPRRGTGSKVSGAGAAGSISSGMWA